MGQGTSSKASVRRNESEWSNSILARGCRSACVFEWIDIDPPGPILAQLATSDAPNQPNLRSFYSCEASCIAQLRLSIFANLTASAILLERSAKGPGMLLDCGNDKLVQAHPLDDSFDGLEILPFLLCWKESHDEAA